MNARERINAAAQDAGWGISSYGVNGSGQYFRPDGQEMICVSYSTRETVTEAHRRPLLSSQATGDETPFVGGGRADQIIAYMKEHDDEEQFLTDEQYAVAIAELYSLGDKVLSALERVEAPLCDVTQGWLDQLQNTSPDA